MQNREGSHEAAERAARLWLRYALIALVCEKIIQHLVVTLGFYFNWKAIRSTVAVSPDLLMVLGGLVAVGFAVALWGLVRRQEWTSNLLIALAVFDIIGELAAPGPRHKLA